MELKFVEKGFDPDELGSCIGYRLILGLSTGPRNGLLFSRAPG